MKTQTAKIILHSSGLGAPSAEVIRVRATELARIDGRDEAGDEDWRQAKRELHGGHTESASDSELTLASLYDSCEVSEGTYGHQTERQPPDEEMNVAEELVAEGMDEAEHEQMLAASERGKNEE